MWAAKLSFCRTTWNQIMQRDAAVKITKRCASSGVSKNKKYRNFTSRKIEEIGSSLSCKGFLRSTKPYTALADASERILAICTKLKIPCDSGQKLANLHEKYQFLTECFKDFQHGIPNSQIYEMRTVGDVIEFYNTSVDTTVPYDAMKTMDLPENLSIQYEYMRFNPDTDTKFGGKTAFPRSSTLVTGLKYREKYAGHIAKRSWP